MHVRFMVIAAAALSISATAVAEPTQPAAHDASPPARPPAQVVLASAEQAQAPSPAPDQQPAAAPVKHRAARVTTCRFGDQVEQPDQ